MGGTGALKAAKKHYPDSVTEVTARQAAAKLSAQAAAEGKTAGMFFDVKAFTRLQKHGCGEGRGSVPGGAADHAGGLHRGQRYHGGVRAASWRRVLIRPAT